MDAALYHPQLGYYSSATNRIGREGDFYTSPDLDPIFGKLLAHQFEVFSHDIPDFAVLELGAGKGLVARDILRERKFRYLILERSAAMRDRQRDALQGFDVEWIDDLPSVFNGVIFSNEFFDALPVHRFVRRAGDLKEIFVGDGFKETERPPSVVIDLPLKDDQIADVCLDACDWMRRIAASLRAGFHIAIDYGYTRDEFFARPRGTLMCYRQHQAHEDPYMHIGDQDMTAHVNFSDLMTAAGMETVRFTSQKDFLIDLGLLDEMQKLAVAGDGESMQRLTRMKNLILPQGMGERFKVLVQRRA